MKTVAASVLIHQAEMIEQSAKQSVDAWVLCGVSYRYYEALEKAYAYRRAAAMRNIHERRAYLASKGL